METAFKVLRSAGYAAHALSVAERAGQPEWILDVLLEDMASYAEAVAFIGERGTLCARAERGSCLLLSEVAGCQLTRLTRISAR
jgi:hypothetical protein